MLEYLRTLYQCNSGQTGSRTGGQNQISHEVLITRRHSIFDFFANPGRGWPQHPVPASPSQHWPFEANLCLYLQKNKKRFVFWLSGPHRTFNFDHQSLIHSDLNYTTLYLNHEQKYPVILRIYRKCNFLSRLYSIAQTLQTASTYKSGMVVHSSML